MTVTTEVDINLDVAAKWFAGLSDDDWARFFAKVAAEIEQWPTGSYGRYCFLSAVGNHMVTCTCSTLAARMLISDLAEAIAEFQRQQDLQVQDNAH